MTGTKTFRMITPELPIATVIAILTLREAAFLASAKNNEAECERLMSRARALEAEYMGEGQ